jgi:CheY-like chemotaxis protein
MKAMRILIVDDDLVSREKLKALLSAYGECTTVPNAEWALKKIKHANDHTRPYELITVDVEMPGMRGEEMVHELRQWEQAQKTYKKDREIKVLMVTSKKDPETVIASFREGCEWYLNKPVNPENLTAALERLDIQQEQAV